MEKQLFHMLGCAEWQTSISAETPRVTPTKRSPTGWRTGPEPQGELSLTQHYPSKNSNEMEQDPMGLVPHVLCSPLSVEKL